MDVPWAVPGDSPTALTSRSGALSRLLRRAEADDALAGELLHRGDQMEVLVGYLVRRIPPGGVLDHRLQLQGRSFEAERRPVAAASHVRVVLPQRGDDLFVDLAVRWHEVIGDDVLRGFLPARGAAVVEVRVLLRQHHGV